MSESDDKAGAKPQQDWNALRREFQREFDADLARAKEEFSAQLAAVTKEYDAAIARAEAAERVVEESREMLIVMGTVRQDSIRWALVTALAQYDAARKGE